MRISEINYSPPSPDEIELSFLGPGAGYGESIIIHACNNNWFIIDSCMDSETNKPLPLLYLEKIGVDPSCVKRIIASHWHDDHVRGISELVNCYPEAKLVITDVCETNQFKLLYSAYNSRSDFNSGIREFLKLNPFTHTNFDRYITAKVDTIIWRDSVEDKIFQIGAISPSNHLANIARAELTRLIPSAGEHPKRVRSIPENSCSIALLLNFGDDNIILGSDLEDHNSIEKGWKAVINDCLIVKGQVATVFKVPHHGSRGAINKDLWNDYLENPISVISPYIGGQVALPKEEELNYIDNNSGATYLTSPLYSPRIKDRKFAINKAIESLGLKIEEIKKSFGHVQLRKLNSSSKGWSINLYGTAMKYTIEQS